MLLLEVRTAKYASTLIGVNAKTAITYFHRLREIITLEQSRNANNFLDGEIEVDESYFGVARKGNQGQGAVAKIPVFSLLKRNGKVYTAIIADAKTATLMPIIRQKIKPDGIIVIVGKLTVLLMFRNLNTIV